jgi:type III secretion protein Q
LLQRDRWEAVEASVRPWWCDRLSWGIGVPVASTRLHVATLEAIKPGDVIAPSESGTANLLTLRMGSALVEWAAEAHDPTTLVCKSWRTEPVSNQLTSESNGEIFPIDGIDIAVQFVAGRIDMSLGELRALRAGSLIQLVKHAGARVDIVAGGQKIGIGEMVSIDGLLAIEVVEMSRAP